MICDHLFGQIGGFVHRCEPQHMGLHVVGDRFVALDPDAVLRPPLEAQWVGASVLYRGVTLGTTLDAAGTSSVVPAAP